MRLVLSGGKPTSPPEKQSGPRASGSAPARAGGAHRGVELPAGEEGFRTGDGRRRGDGRAGSGSRRGEPLGAGRGAGSCCGGCDEAYPLLFWRVGDRCLADEEVCGRFPFYWEQDQGGLDG